MNHPLFRIAATVRILTGILSAALVVCIAPPAARAENWALLIGIDQYEDKNRINALGAAATDARSLKSALVETAGFPETNVRLLVSDGDAKPTRSNILTELARLAKNVAPGDTVFVLYSGHGVEIAGVPYLLPFDTTAIDDDTLADSALPVTKFRQRLAQIKAKALILAFDMCRSDPRKTGKDVAASDNKLSKSMARGLDFKKTAANTGDGAAPSAASPVAITLYSCSPNERSYEWVDKGRGYFSYYLEQGLRGKAADANGKVTVLSLSNYISREVQSAVKRGEQKTQTPYPSLDGPGADSFVLTKGKATPPPDTSGDVDPDPVKVTDTKARLAVTVNAKNATVSVDGVAVKNGAFAANLLDEEEKAVKVKVTAPGYEGQLMTVTLRRGKTVPLAVKLEAATPAPVPDPLPDVETAVRKVALAYRLEAGKVTRVTGRATMTLTSGGEQADVSLNGTGQITVRKVSENGEVTMQMRNSVEITFNGQTVPPEAPDVSLVTIKPNGELIGFRAENDDEPENDLGARTQVAAMPIFPVKPVGKGDRWAHDYKKNAALGTRAAHADFELVAFEKIGEVDAAKIKFAYKEAGADPITVKGFVYVNVKTGEPIRDNYDVTGIPFGGDAAVKASGSFRDEYVGE